MSKALKRARRNRGRAQHEVELALRRDYKPGAPVTWELSGLGPEYTGEVVRLCYGDRLEVRNTKTGRTRFIRAAQIVCG